MLNAVIGTMVALSLVSGAVLGRMDQIGNAILQTGSQVANLCLVLLGSMCLWGGLLAIATKSGLTKKMASVLYPVVSFLFPGLKKGEEASQVISLGIIANLIGLGAAATPLGLRAMQLLHQKSGGDVASNHMVTLVVLNTASIQIIPTTTAALRQASGCATPLDILIPVWIASVASVSVALILSKVLRR